MSNDIRDSLRVSLRQARRSISVEQQDAAAMNLYHLLSTQDFFRSAKRIAFYQGIDGEISPQPLLDLALNEGKSCFLPVIRKNSLERKNSTELISFAPFNKQTELIKNQWGVQEPPVPGVVVPATQFDVVFVPLVGFNQQCYRIGMGKGFYDRAFSFKISNQHSQPLLVGLAHECQLVKGNFPLESWDVRLDAIATDKKIYRPDTA